MCRIAAFVAIAAVLAACGASATSTKPQPIVFGLGGGTVRPFRVTIEPNGDIRHTSSVKPRRHRLSRAKAASLSRLVRRDFADGLTSRECSGANPDVSSEFIRASGRTITVHGSCEPSFTKLWGTLAQAIGLRFG